VVGIWTSRANNTPTLLLIILVQNSNRQVRPADTGQRDETECGLCPFSCETLALEMGSQDGFYR
jgi:hypothetical protein